MNVPIDHAAAPKREEADWCCSYCCARWDKGGGGGEGEALFNILRNIFALLLHVLI